MFVREINVSAVGFAARLRAAYLPFRPERKRAYDG
jgi:hypothetical protein